MARQPAEEQFNFNQGMKALEKGNYKEALSYFTPVLNAYPSHLKALYYAGKCHYLLDEYEKAGEHFKKVVQSGRAASLFPEQPGEVHLYLMRSIIDLNTQEALKVGLEGLELQPQSPYLQVVTGNCYYRMNQYEPALKHYDKAAQIEGSKPAYPDYPGRIPYNRSTALRNLKRYPEALEAVEEAIRRDPKEALFYNQKGVILGDGFKDYPGAVQWCKKALELDPEMNQTVKDGVYYYNAALYLMEQAKFLEAASYVEQALKFAPEDSSYKSLKKEIDQGLEQKGAAVPGKPKYAFADVGGMEKLKDEIRQIMKVIHTERTSARQYKIEKNGILLYGPPGCGKTFFAEAVAGEYGLNFFKVSISSVMSKWIGESAQNISKVFREALGKLPCLIFFDEFDAIAAKRGEIAGHMEYRQLVDSLLQEIDRHHSVEGLVIMAATNHLEDLDKSVIRDGRFDYKVRIEKPDYEARLGILQARLRGRPAETDLDLSRFAKDTEGFSAAQLSLVINDASLAAMEEKRSIGNSHLQQAYKKQLARDRFAGKRLGWDSLILEEGTKSKLQFIEKFIEHPKMVDALGIEAPTGVLLYGPPGTGKTTIARVLASEVEASFYPISASDVYSKWFGESEKKVKEIFEKARDNPPSIIFIDEIDSILSKRGAAESGGEAARNTIINLFLSEMDGISDNRGVFVVGATNRAELLDEAALRPGRLSEKIEIKLPASEQRLQMLGLFTRKMRLAEDVRLEELSKLAENFSGADLEGLCGLAGRNALMRTLSQAETPSIQMGDFLKALEEVKPKVAEKKRIGFSQEPG